MNQTIFTIKLLSHDFVVQFSFDIVEPNRNRLLFVIQKDETLINAREQKVFVIEMDEILINACAKSKKNQDIMS